GGRLLPGADAHRPVPEMDIPTVTITTPYPGAGPREIEEEITRPIEEAVSTVQDVDHVFSSSREGQSTVRVTFDWQTDLDTRTNDIRSALDQVQDRIPDEAEDSRIFQFDVSQFPILVYGVRATTSYEELEQIMDDRVETPLESIPGVASARAIVPLNRQINVDLNREKLAAHNLTPARIAHIIDRENEEISAGSIEMGYTDYLPRVPMEFETVDPMRDIVVQASGGSIVRLRDVGEVSDGFEEIDRYININGKPGAILLINNQSEANTVEVADAVKSRLPQIQERLPADVRLMNVMDSSADIRRMVSNLVWTLILGGALAMVAVFVFLRRVRATIVIGLAIPFSLILSGAVMYIVDYTVNMMTLFALIVAIGMVVDNSIVVLENVTRHREQGESPEEGSVYGASEVAMAITASTLTTLCIFFPLLFVKGMTQIIFVPFAVVAAIVILASLFCAVTLTPTLACYLMPGQFGDEEEQNVIFRASERAFNAMADAYGSLLGWCLRHRAVAIFGAVILLAGSGSLVGLIGYGFFPDQDQGTIRGTIEMPVGTRVEKTAEVMDAIENMLREEIDERYINATYTRCGESDSPVDQDTGAYIGSFSVDLVPKGERPWTVFEKAGRVRERLEEMSSLHGIDSFQVTLEDVMASLISGGEKPLTINIYGSDIEETTDVARRIQDIVQSVRGPVDVTLSRDPGAPELWVDVNRDKASSMGLNASDVGQAVRTSIYGRVADRYRVGGDEYDIFVRLRKQDRADAADLAQIPLALPSGKFIRVGNVADIRFATGPIKIERKDQQRIVNVEGDVQGRSQGEVVADIERKLADMEIPAGVRVEMGGETEERRQAFFWLTLALGVAMVLVYMVMASQFESLIHPFVIMFSLPFAFAGVAWGLWLGGFALNVIVFLGMLLLIGVVVNNAIVLVDYINILRARGRSMTEAIREAGKTRLRPVLMTAFTTIFGLLPMALKGGQGSEVWNPMGTTIVSGLLMGTVVTLVIIPVMYSILEVSDRPAA
ncbi:MAG: efflux RND transporter permease subunit, partial [Planctomycetota bacterium]